jgi:hypothetical protein
MADDTQIDMDALERVRKNLPPQATTTRQMIDTMAALEARDGAVSTKDALATLATAITQLELEVKGVHAPER